MKQVNPLAYKISNNHTEKKVISSDFKTAPLFSGWDIF